MADEERAFVEEMGRDPDPKLLPKTVDPTEEIDPAHVEEEKGPSPVSLPSLGSVTSSNLFRHPDAHPIALDLVLLRRYDPEWMAWEPEYLEHRIAQDFKTSVSHLALHKIHALKTLHFVDTFWEQWEVFLWCTMAFNGVPPDFVVMQVPTVAQCMVSVDIANRIRDDLKWSHDIKEFLGAVHRHDGILVSQEPLTFVHVDTANYFVDPDEVKKLWPKVRLTKQEPRGDTVTDEQLRRMLVVHKYLEESHERLRQQLPMVSHA